MNNQTTYRTIWISYDLGIQGDYEGLYAWLDEKKAKECGDSLAVLKYGFKNSLPDEIKTELKKEIKTDKRTRIYVVYRDKETTKNKGIFIFGGRRAAAWAGYDRSTTSASDDED